MFLVSRLFSPDPKGRLGGKLGSACEEFKDNEGGILGRCFSVPDKKPLNFVMRHTLWHQKTNRVVIDVYNVVIMDRHT